MTYKIIATVPSNKAGLMYPCKGQTDSYCCSEDNYPCSCETGNVTLAPLAKDVSSIAFLGLEAVKTQSAQSSTATSRCLDNDYLERCLHGLKTQLEKRLHSELRLLQQSLHQHHRIQRSHI